MMKIPRNAWALMLAGAGTFCSLCELRADTSVSYYGITWTFASDRPTGTFANGEPWVVGPVTVSNIDPNPSQSANGTQHGSMKNPIPNAKQGFDSNPVTIAQTAYDPALNVALSFPINLVAGDVLVSSKTVYAYPNYFDTVCVLTVLATAPPVGSFRPGPYGTDRTVRWNKSNINYGVLKNFATVSGAPTKAQIEAKLPALPWWEWSGSWTGGLLVPWRNVAAMTADGRPSTYGREIAAKWGDVALWLNLNHSQADKEKAMIQTIQCGIDIWSFVSNGGDFYHDGGHKCGRKFPVLLAALALNDSTLRTFARNPDIFQEDTQTFIVQQSDVGRVVQGETFVQSHVGMAEWGVRHRWDPNKDDSRFEGGVPYRHVVWPAMAGAVLAAEMMGQKAAWGHPAIFAYNSRYRSLRGLGGFAGAMWDAYEGGGGTVSSVTNFFTQSYTGTRNNYTGSVGYEFTPTQDLTVTAVGRSASGSITQSHAVRIWRVSNASLMASATVTASSRVDGLGYSYELLGAPVTLLNGVTYRIATDEASGGDVWMDLTVAAGHSSGAVINRGVYGASEAYPDGVAGVVNSVYGPPTFFTGGTTGFVSTVAAPTFSPAAGDYTNAQTVTISSATSGATIRYTTDGSTPSAMVGTVYSTPVTIAATTTLKAIATQSGMTDSGVTSGTYTIVTDGASLGAELLSNPGFETDLTAWTGNSGATLTRITGWTHTGIGSCDSRNNGGTTGGPMQSNLMAALNASGPGTYELSAWVALGDSGTRTCSVFMGLKGSGAATYPGIFDGTLTSGTWVQVSGTVELTWEGVLTMANFYVAVSPSYTAIYVDDCSLRKVMDTTAAAPTFSLASGTYAGAQTVTIRSATSGAAIRYTTDGSTPSATVGTVYSAPVTIAATTTLKAIATMSGKTDSSVASASYTITIPNVAAPTFSPAAGTYTTAQTVTISSATSGATIRYTTDGRTPSATVGTVYSAPVTIAATTTLKAIATNSGMTDSGVSSGEYTNGGGNWELLSNVGFEENVAGWTAHGGATIGHAMGWTHAGVGSCYSGKSSGTTGGPVQANLMAALTASGPGSYDLSAWVALGAGLGTRTGNVFMGLKGSGPATYPGIFDGVLTEGVWTKVSGTVELTWEGPLTMANFYVSATPSYVDIYVDDCSLKRSSDSKGTLLVMQ